MPVDDVHARRQPTRDGRARRRRPAPTKHLVGREPPGDAVAIATSAPSGSARAGSARRRSGRPAAGRTNWPRAIGRDLRRSVSATTGKASRPASIGRRSGSEPGRAVGGRGPDRRRARSASSSVNGPDAVRVERAEVGARSRAASPRSRASARTYVPAEHATSTTAIGRSGSVSSHVDEVERVDRHLARRELDGLARPRQRVGAAAADLDRAVGRRELRDRAGRTRPAPPRPPRASAPARRPGVSSPSRSSVVDDAPKQTVAR